MCVAAVVSELIVIAFGVGLAPKGIFDRRLVRLMLLALASGAAMTLVALITKPLMPFVAVPLSLLTYVLGLWLTGAIDEDQIAAIRGTMGRGFSRLAAIRFSSWS